MKIWNALLLAAVLVPTGCHTSGSGPSKGVITAKSAPVDQLHLISLPVGVDLDGKPGADGFVIKIFASRRGSARPVAIRSGTLDVLLFEGILENLEKSKPVREWHFTASDLKKTQVPSSIGPAYQVSLAWDHSAPLKSQFTVLVRWHEKAFRPIEVATTVMNAAAR